MKLLGRLATCVLLSTSVATCTGGEKVAPLQTLQIPNDPDCDPLVPDVCGMPFPSSRWLVPDASRPTGLRLELGPTTLPANAAGVHVDPAPYRRLDGYGLGVPALAYFPDLDGADLPGEDRIADSMTPDARVMMFAARPSGFVRIPCFAEIDLRGDDDTKRALVIRPAVLLEEGTRYVVALRGLKKKDGSPVPPSDAFVALRDHRAEGTPVADRAAHFDEIFQGLEAAGVPRAGLLLAWDWTTASNEALHGPLLHMRDESLAALGDASPKITVTSITPYSTTENASIAYEVLGTFEVPDYTVPVSVNGAPAHVLDWGADGLPRKTGVYQAELRARIPRSALSGEPHGVMIHGHGLNGTDAQIATDTFDQLANQEKVVVVGCNMLGMSAEDVPATLQMLSDLSSFPILADRLHQGVLDHVFLARAMKKGFDKVPEIAATGLVIDPSAIYYSGISQGGIFGATHMAMSVDITRGHLGVPGNDYATLLPRSVDFSPFFVVLGLSYPDHRDQQLLLAAIQNLWDRTDPVSHYRHISAEPYPGTPSHQVLLAPAVGDWQVAPLTNEIVARSDVGVAVMDHYGRDVALVTPAQYPRVGSGIVSYDFGNPWAKPGDLPPSDDVGDPHGKPRSLAWHNEQMFHFFRTGEIIDVCGGDGCTPQ
jgi:hypothetical protein